MDKGILMDYVDSCKLVKETEQDIARIMQKQRNTQDIVSGSNPEFPYESRHFRIEGISYADDERLRKEMVRLAERKKSAEEKKEAVEEWMLTLTSRMQRIIRYHIFDGLSWEATAAQIGRNATGESIRKEYKKLFEDN